MSKKLTQAELKEMISGKLSHLFGVSPKEYITQKRIEYAKILLSSGDFLVSEVGILCGYAEPCHFSREFSRRVGMIPSRYFEK